MAGHSKFANRKHRKARQDNKRAKIFTKISKEIIMAARAGGEDPSTNSRLRLALELARQNNMPKDNIKRAIDRATGNNDDTVFEEFTYEGYGPGGVAVLIEIATDNRNRTAAEVRHSFSKYGGSLGQNGCVSWMFERKGVIRIDRDSSNIDEDTLFEAVLEAGGDDMVTEEGLFTIYTASDDFLTVMESLNLAGITSNESGIEFIANNTTNVTEDIAEKLIVLIDHLEDSDDVQRVFYNAVFTE